MSEEELEAKMAKVHKAQKKCLRIQIIIIFLTIAAYEFGFIPLVLNILLGMTWGIYLRHKATSLARIKYPIFGLVRDGTGVSYDPPIMNAALRCGDKVTYELLAFNWWSIYAAVGSFFAYMFMITVGKMIISWIKALVLAVI